MNVIVIILSIFVVFLLYILINYFSNNSTKLASETSLLSNNVIVPVKSSPNATRYALSIWLCVNSWNNYDKIIYEFPGKIKLYLDTTTPTLKVNIGTVKDPVIIIITPNFPLQKWTYVTVSVDNYFVDCYIDGKLIKSIKLENLQSTNTEATIYIGGKVTTANDTLISNFYRWTNALAPHEVWNQYIKGNGSNFLSRTFSSYGLDINLKKDNIISSTIHLL